jgi:sugar lactone lactonase YvrE
MQPLTPLSTMMDSVGLDTVEHIEQHYVDDRKLPTSHLDWLKENYISAGKLGNKSDKGGLYPRKDPGEGTKLLLLNVGLGEPLRGKSQEEIMHAGQVLSFNVDDRNARPIELVGKLALPDGIYVSDKTKRMYWTNMGTVKGNAGSIQSANLDGSDVQYVLKPGQIHTPKQMVIDQETDQIYVCDREGQRVMRCNLDGSELETLYRTGDWEKEPEKSENGVYWPVGITLSKKLGKFFWTQKGHSKANEGRIFSANIGMPKGCNPDDRSDVELVMEGLPECIDLEMDDDSGVLYWTDRGEVPFGNTLNKKQIIGEAPEAEGKLGRQIIAQGLGEGIGLCLDRKRNCLYVADMSGHLWRCSADGGPKEKLYEGATHAYTGVTFINH